MFTLAIWWLGVFLETLLIGRGCGGKLITRFPVFYSYILFVFLQDILRMSVLKWLPDRYSQVYWITQFVSFVLGSAVIFEIYRVALRIFPGTAKMARNLLLVLFGIVFARALALPFGGFSGRIAHAFEILEKQLRMLQGLALLGLVVVFLWYAIPFGKNLWCILLGYSVFVVASAFQLALFTNHVNQIGEYWPYVQPFTYLLVLTLWTWGLWSEYPVPVAGREMQLESDYESLVASTSRQLERLRSRARRTVLP